MVEEGREKRKVRGMRHALIAIVAAALMVTPSYVAYVVLHRLKLDIGVTAVVSLVLFLIGVFLLVRLVAE
jgi:hypothetical protein